ncbi:Bifunctional lysine-specific demethylase and histidyl-hydroxylase MINA [Exaiptasia diaphana]|nr:Bifunctional lysine-specific demethylase and histidyl-hydroxylase MINA [Exaiptasia diaphana]
MKRKNRSSSSTNDERKSKKTRKVSDLEEIQELSKLDFNSAEKLFSSLIAPITSKTFFSEYWEKKPLLIKRNDISFYGPLFSKSDLEAVLKKEEIEFVNDVNVCCYEDGDKLYMNDDIGSRATWTRVSKDVKERNATVQFHQPQRFKDILWKLTAHLESVFGCLVGANVYITPSNSQGLAPHYDDVEEI